MKRNDHYISKIISASLMGDGFILKDDPGGRNRNGQFRIRQIEQHKDHLDYLAERILPVTSIKFDYTAPKSDIVICNKQTKASGVYLLRTQNHPMFTDFRSRWYLNRVKHIDPHALTLIDAEFMAIWYMQDGYTTSRIDCKNDDTVLCTDNFTFGDLSMIRNAIIEKTGFVFNVRKKGINTLGEQTYRMYLYRKQTPEFRAYIAPFMQQSFLYKITGDTQTGNDIVCSA